MLRLPVELPRLLGWQFLALSDYLGGRPVFFQVDGEQLRVYADLGRAALRIGGEALVPLAGFSLRPISAPGCAGPTAGSPTSAPASR